jgi:hypothetical protein
MGGIQGSVDTSARRRSIFGSHLMLSRSLALVTK